MKRRMRILIVTGIYPPDIGGPAVYVPRIAGRLAERHDVVGVITLADGHADDTRSPFPVLRLPRGQWRPLRWMRTILAIARAARGADVVYANGLLLETVVATRLLTRRAVVAKIVGDLIWERARNAGLGLELEAFQAADLPVRWRLLRSLQGAYLRRCDGVVVPSRFLARIVSGWGVKPGRIAVVMNSAEPPTAPLADPPIRHDIVTVARLVPWKGVAPLIAIAARRGWRLLVIGDGPLRGELQRTAASLGAAATFVGSVPQKDVAGLMRSARVFVLNSAYEGLPHIVLEAKQARLPVVATSVGGTPEVIEDGKDGILVPAGNEEALEAAISGLLDDPERARTLVAAGLSQIAARFSVEAMVEATERVLAEAVPGSAA
jgi:glycosyltransferase involved in cell wall biosynthesis